MSVAYTIMVNDLQSQSCVKYLRRCCLGGGSPSECGSKSPSSIEARDSTLELDSKLRLRGAS